MTRAILIDPEQRSVIEIKIRKGIKEIHRVLGCKCITTTRPLNSSLLEGSDIIYVDDEFLLKDGEGPRFWFQVDADRNPPSSYPIGSKGLVVGNDKRGYDCDARISVAELQSRITFTQRKFRGLTELRATERELWGAPARFFSFGAKTPIIDGTNE